MGWLRQHAASIQDWAAMLEAAAITLKYVRNHGYTKGVLTMASAVLAITAETVQIAFQRVKTKDVWRWAEQTLGLSLQSQRQRAIPLLNKPQTE